VRPLPIPNPPCLPSSPHKAEVPCSKPEEGEDRLLKAESVEVGAATHRQLIPATASTGRSKRQFEEDAEDEDGARLRRKHLLSVATSDAIRSALGDDRLLDIVARIDAAGRAEQALDVACEDPEFREFTEKVLNTLDCASEDK